MSNVIKISKEKLLQAALELLIEHGCSGVTIKAVSNRIGCSTQPISRQFGGMPGLRNELVKEAERYAIKKYFASSGSALASFEHTGWGVINMAIDEPNLYRFLYMGESGRSDFVALTKPAEINEKKLRVSASLGITPEEADNFVMTMVFYTQGLATMIVSGIVQSDRNTILQMVRETGLMYLKALGVSREKALSLCSDYSCGDAPTEDAANDFNCAARKNGKSPAC